MNVSRTIPGVRPKQAYGLLLLGTPTARARSETLIDAFAITDPAVQQIARIVHGVGLHAIADGFALLDVDDPHPESLR
jgi:hypothetical protein